jgi:hypothetical protein
VSLRIAIGVEGVFVGIVGFPLFSGGGRHDAARARRSVARITPVLVEVLA